MKQGWVRWSLHPTMTDHEVRYIVEDIAQIVENIDSWKQDYVYHPRKNEYSHVIYIEKGKEEVDNWFRLG